MQIKKILSKKEIEEIEDIIEKNYGCRIGMKNYRIFVTGEEKIWISSKSIDFDIFNFLKRCYRIGIYFGKLKRNKKIKLSIEGVMMVGKKAIKNIAILNEEEALKYMHGYDVTPDKIVRGELNNFVLIKYREDFIGTGILRENYIENLTPKSRRIVKGKVI
ncbi:MAG TPA: hypothetical protein ENI52_02705 [Thermoplasmata archaeon]|nr:hypothetical protein [Thermoplasmata archaeon]